MIEWVGIYLGVGLLIVVATFIMSKYSKMMKVLVEERPLVYLLGLMFIWPIVVPFAVLGVLNVMTNPDLQKFQDKIKKHELELLELKKSKL